MGCNNNGFGGNFLWIIILIIILFGWGGFGIGGNCGCNNGCVGGTNDNGCGCC